MSSADVETREPDDTQNKCDDSHDNFERPCVSPVSSLGSEDEKDNKQMSLRIGNDEATNKDQSKCKDSLRKADAHGGRDSNFDEGEDRGMKQESMKNGPAKLKTRDEVPAGVHLDPFQTIMSRTPKPHYVPKLTVGILLFELILVGIDSYKGFQLQSGHSKCIGDLFPSLLVIALRALSRIAFPLAIFVYFCNWVATKQDCSVREKFISEIVNPRNKVIASEFMKRFVNPHSQDEAGTKEHLRYIQQYLDSYLWELVKLSFSQTLVLMVALACFSVFDLSPTWYIFIELADLFFFGVILFVCGTVMSLLFLDGQIKHYFRQFRAYCTTKQLKQKAKAVDDCISERWYLLNKLISIMTVLFCILLIVSWASGTPLTCGVSISNGAVSNQSASGFWLVFILVLTFGQFCGTNPTSIAFGVISITVEVIVLVLLRILSPTLEWSKFTHILYAIIPLSYFLWYHGMSLPRQWAGINIKAKNSTADSRTVYWSRFCSRSALITLILCALTLSVHTEYKHITPSAIDQYSQVYVPVNVDLSPPPEYDEETMKLILDYIKKYCSIHPSTSQLDSSIPCLHLNPGLFEDKETQDVIAKSISMVQTLWSVHHRGNKKHLLTKQPPNMESTQ